MSKPKRPKWSVDRRQLLTSTLIVIATTTIARLDKLIDRVWPERSSSSPTTHARRVGDHVLVAEPGPFKITASAATFNVTVPAATATITNTNVRK